MDNILQALLSWQFLLFCLMVAGVTFVIRSIVEYCIDNPNIPTGTVSKKSTIWTGLILPIMPVMLGTVFGLVMKQYPYPAGMAITSGRFVFGLVAGLLSGLVYRVISATLYSKVSAVTQVVIPDQSTEELAAEVRKTINQ